MEFADPDNITGIMAYVTLLESSPIIPKARIGGYFLSNSNTDIFSEIAVHDNRIVFSSVEDYSQDGLSWNGDEIFREEWVFEHGLIGEEIRIVLKHDESESKLYFIANIGENYHRSTSHSTIGMFAPQRKGKRIESVINMVLADDSPTISWQPVPGAARYWVDVFRTGAYFQEFNFSTIDDPETGLPPTSFRIPPGVLKPYAEYEYKVSALRTHSPRDKDDFGTSSRVRFRTGPPSEAPYIMLDSTGVNVWRSDENAPYLSYWIRVYDAQGVPGNIKYVKVEHPNGEEIPLVYDSKSTGLSIKSGYYRTDDYKRTAQSGEYIFTVEDLDGNKHVVKEHLEANPVSTVTDIRINGLPAHGALLNTTAADLTWNPVSGAKFYRVELYDPALSLYKLSTESNSLSLPEGFLKEGTLYGARVTARREYFTQNVENGSASHPEFSLANFRTTGILGNYENKPMITFQNDQNPFLKGAYVWTFPKFINGVTVPTYWLAFEARVEDSDGVPGNIKTVKVKLPIGSSELVLNYNSRINGSAAVYWNRIPFDDWRDIPTGIYTFIVEDFDGNTTEITDDLTFTGPIEIPENIWPGNGDFVIEETPVVEWDEVPDAVAYRVRLFRGWSNMIPPESPVIEANNYYEIPAGRLNAGESYSLRVYAFAENPATGDVDSLSSSSCPIYAQTPQFTVEIQQDLDGDGIYGAIDDPNTANAFAEIDGPTYGFIMNRGGQTLKIYDRAGVEGVFIETDAGVVGAPAQIDVCGSSGILWINESAHMRVICGSVKINVLKGAVTAEFTAINGQVAVSTITQESSGLLLTFDPDTFSFTATAIQQSTEGDPLPTAPIVVVKEDTGVALEVAENGASQVVRIDIKPGDPNNNFNPAGGGVLPVTIFGDANFDVTKIALDSLRLEGMELKLAGKKIYHRFEKADGDQYLDLTVQFADTDKVMSPGEAKVALTGIMMMSGDKIIGRDKLTIQP